MLLLFVNSDIFVSLKFYYSVIRLFLFFFFLFTRHDHLYLEFNRALGTDEPLFNMNSGRLQASLDRVEAIVTHSSWLVVKTSGISHDQDLYRSIWGWLLRKLTICWIWNCQKNIKIYSALLNSKYLEFCTIYLWNVHLILCVLTSMCSTVCKHACQYVLVSASALNMLLFTYYWWVVLHNRPLWEFHFLSNEFYSFIVFSELHLDCNE